MDYFGINSADDLPKISEVLIEELVQATNVKEAEDNMEFENTVEAEITNEDVAEKADEIDDNLPVTETDSNTEEVSIEPNPDQENN